MSKQGSRGSKLESSLHPILLCSRETARKLRQRKVEALQRLQKEVMELAKENHFLAEKLETSISKVLLPFQAVKE